MGTIGIDEVGRGCWAGPLLVVAARHTGNLPTGLQDSKILSKKRREILFFEIEPACELGEGWVQPAEIDAIGLSGAMRLGVERALIALNAKFNEQIIMDGDINYCGPKFLNVRAIIDADALHPIVSAASIYAKVKRDNFMAKLSEPYKKYGFEKHVGYGTKLHQEMLKLYGVSELHRLSYKPVKAFL